MIFLIPSAKEMQLTQAAEQRELSPKTQLIVKQLAQCDLDQLADVYKISPDHAQKEAEHIAELEAGSAQAYPAIQLFNGLMYRYIDRDLTSLDQSFTQEHVFITSALYGIIPATDPISPHRLDFNCKLKLDGKSLKAYWRKEYDRFLSDTDQPIISLLSSEFESVFSPSLAKSLIRIHFHEEHQGQLKTHSTISKKARGAFISQIIHQKIQDLSAIKNLSFDGYTYREKLSDANTLVFVRPKP